ncbi:MAG TPA: hypothetical protein VNO55_03025, partial [Polyangia bacterium]|nr:hypothetical protein [Polyangia bacterium]
MARRLKVLLPYWCTCFAVGIAVSALFSFAVGPCIALAVAAAAFAALLAWRGAWRTGVGFLLVEVGALLACRAAPPEGMIPADAVVAGRVDAGRPSLIEGVVQHGPESATRGTRLVV